MLIVRPPAADRRILALYLHLPEVPKAGRDLQFEVPDEMPPEDAAAITDGLISLLDVLNYGFRRDGEQFVAEPPRKKKT